MRTPSPIRGLRGPFDPSAFPLHSEVVVDVPPPEPRSDVDPWLLFGVALFGVFTLMLVFHRRRRTRAEG